MKGTSQKLLVYFDSNAIRNGLAAASFCSSHEKTIGQFKKIYLNKIN